MLQNHTCRRGVIKGHHARQHLIQNHTQRIQVGLGYSLGGFAGLFGRDIVRGAESFTQRALRHIQRQAKIGQHHAPIPRQHDVGGFDIAVNHAMPMGMIKGIGNSIPNADNITVGHGVAVTGIFTQALREVFAVDVFHRKKINTLFFACIKNLHDVFMSPRGHCPCFLDKPPRIGGILAIAAINHLNSHRPLQLHIPRIKHLGHPAPPQNTL